MKKSLFTLFILLIGLSTWAQPPGERGGKYRGQNQTKGEIFGSVMDSITSKPVGYATIVALNSRSNKMIGGAVTDEKGAFSIPDLPMGLYQLKITFVGYNTTFINEIKLTAEKSTYQLKNFQLSPTVLNTVEVVGEKPLVTYEIDKKVINVEDQLNTDGQSATEILENIPSVTVSADGTVSLRGSSSFTLLIDGIPTAMDASDALATIPASTIENIEIITNPSAKFDAEGTSGVINIITKKSKLEGISCLVNLSAGRFNNYNSDVSLNVKKKKWTFDLNAMVSDRGRPRIQENERITTYDSTVNTLLSFGESNWRRQSYGAGGGIQWSPNNSHLFSLRTDFKWTDMIPYSILEYENYDNDSLIETFRTDALNHIELFNNTSNFFYQYNIKRNKDHHISVKAIANLKYVTQNDSTLNYEDGTLSSGNIYTETGPSNSYRFNIDYKLPLTKDSKFETGLQAQFGKSGDIGRNYVFNELTGAYDLNELFSSDVNYRRDVHAAYAIYGGKFKRLGYQAGLRAEYTFREITSTQAVEFATINRLDWFPSAHLSYSFNNKSQLLLSYSRRIKRPRSWFFEPFVTWEGPYSVRSGNPDLNPEYINAFELSFVKPIKKHKGFFSAEAYQRINRGFMGWISTVYDDGILIRKPYNLGSSTSSGLELSINYKLTKWYTVNAGGNAYYYDLNGAIDDVNYSTSSFNYGGRITNSFDLNGWMIQLVSRYRSGSVSPQGEKLGAFVQDITLKKSFWNKKLAVTLQSRNVLATDRNVSFSKTQNVVLNSYGYPMAPGFMATVSLKLNNYQKVFERQEQLDDF